MKTIKSSSEVDTRKLVYEVKVMMNRYVFVLHDYLLTPVTHILGFVQLLENKKISENPVAREKYLRIVSDESKRLSKNVETAVMFLQKWDVDAVSHMNMRDTLMTVEKGTAEYLKKYYPKITVNDINDN